VQTAANQDPADARDGERDFAGDYDVPLRQFPGRFSGVATPTPLPRAWIGVLVVVVVSLRLDWGTVRDRR
jgi:hypothetical protein